MRRYFTERFVINILTVASTLFFVYAIFEFASAEKREGSEKSEISWLIGGGKIDIEQEGNKDLWYKTEMNGKSAGYVHYQEIKSGDNLLLFNVSKMIIGVMGTKKNITTTTRAILDNENRPRRFTFSVEAPPASFELKGTIRGKSVEIIMKSGDSEDVHKIELQREPTLEIDLMRRLAASGLEVGKRYKTAIFNPQTMGEQEVELEVAGKERIFIRGKEIEAWKVILKSIGVKTEQWIDDAGEGLMATAPLGLKLTRTSRRGALNAYKNAGGDDIIAEASVKVAKQFPRPETLSQLTLKLSGIEFADFELNDDFKQSFKEGFLTIVTENLEEIKPLSLPVEGEEFKKYLEPEPLVQSGDPEIIKAAKRIVGEEKDALKAATKISLWLHDNIKKENVVGIPSATEVLKTRVGDCNEHAVLFVAMARAVGLPARISSGLTSMGGSFFYHAWVEAFVGEWISLDPTFNQIPADVSHIRFVTGGLDKQLYITQLLGNLEIEILEYKEKQQANRSQ